MDIKTLTIMVVEDDITSLELVGDVLAERGFQNVLCFQNPVEALNHYKVEKPHLVLLDIHMPEMNGFAWLDAVNEIADALKPPVMMLTAEETEETAVLALEKGARDFINKPFHIAIFINRVKNLLIDHAEYLALLAQSQQLEAQLNKPDKV